MMQHLWIRYGMVLALAAALLLAAGCGKDDGKTAKIPFVKTQRMGSVTRISPDIYPGSVKARYETNMSFQVGGKILSRNVQAGSRVQAGDVLMTIDPKDVREQAVQGEAQVNSAKAQMDLAQANLHRYAQLYREDVIPAAVLDQYQMNYDAARAAYESALAQSAQAQNALGYARLIASAGGVVSSVDAEEGQVVSPGQTVLVLSRTDELEVEVNVPENHLADMSAGRSVTVRFWAIPGETEGIVREVSPMADAVSRTYSVRVSLSAPPKGMELGMTASVSPKGEASAGKGLAVPLTAIYQSGETPKVWVVENRTVHLRDVEVTDIRGNEASVRGLEEDSLVVIAGVHKLREGQKVRTEEDEG